MTNIHPTLHASSGTGLGKLLIDAELDGDDRIRDDVLRNFTLEQVISSLWETVVWVTGHAGLHGDDETIDQVMTAAEEMLPTSGAAADWAADFHQAVNVALQTDVEFGGFQKARRRRRVIPRRPIFSTWLLIQNQGLPRTFIGFDGHRGKFAASINYTGPGLIQGVTAAATAIVRACADTYDVPAELMLSVVNAIALGRAARGDFD